MHGIEWCRWQNIFEMPHLESIILYLARYFEEIYWKEVKSRCESSNKKKCPICNKLWITIRFFFFFWISRRAQCLPNSKCYQCELGGFFSLSLSELMVLTRVRFITLEITLMNWNKLHRAAIRNEKWKRQNGGTRDHSSNRLLQSINQIKIHQLTHQIDWESCCAVLPLFESNQKHSSIAFIPLGCIASQIYGWLEMTGRRMVLPKYRPLSIWWRCISKISLGGLGAQAIQSKLTNESLYASLFLIIYAIGNG